MVRGTGMRSGSRYLRRTNPRHHHRNVWHFNTRAHSHAKTPSRMRACNTTTHARTHGLVATRSVWRRIHSTTTNLRPQQTQTRLRIHHIAQCHAREAHIKSGSRPRASTRITYMCVCISFQYTPTTGSRRNPEPLARAQVSPRPRPRP